LKIADADIIALQEILEDEKGNSALTLANILGYECVFDIGMQMPEKFLGDPLRKSEEIIRFGNAILSKHKILAHKIYNLSPEGEESRTMVQADIQIADEIVHAFSLHLKHSHQQPLELQNQQANKLISILPTGKLIVMGDFNALPVSYPVEKMRNILQDAEPGQATPTWSVYPGGCSVCKEEGVHYKLDYIFTSKDIKIKSFEIGKTKGSDHLPLYSIIEI